MRALPAVVLLMSMVVRATAGDLTVQIDDGHGHPAGDAVVTLRSDNAQRADVRAPETKIIDQRDETFIPYVEIFRPGDQVVFRNSDTTRHHVYSFAAAKSFEFVIAPGDSSPPVTLDRVGEISVGCNIHDQMITHLYRLRCAMDRAHARRTAARCSTDCRRALTQSTSGIRSCGRGEPGPSQTMPSTIDAGAARAFSLRRCCPIRGRQAIAARY